MKAVAQIIGFVPMVLGFFIFRNISRRASIALKAVSDGLWAVHMLLLDAMPGFAINCVNTVRGVCFAQKGHKAWASGIWMPIIFCCATAVSTAISWQGFLSLLPLCGSCLAVMGYWCSRPQDLRRVNFVGIALWTVYGIITMSVPTVVGNSISLISIIKTELTTKNRR